MDTKGAARFIASLRLDEMRPEVVARAKLCIMDAVGTMLGGLDTQVARIARGLVESRGGKEESTLFGSGVKVPASQAVFANCVAASALDFDDGHRLGGHPASVVVPSALAVAEAQGASGTALMEGVVAGYEIAVRAVQNLVGPEMGGHYGLPVPATGQSYNNTGPGGAYGAAAAAAKVLSCNEAETANALGIAAAHTPSMRPVQIHITGHMVKEGIGWGGFTGVEAAYLAQHGFTGPNTIFDDDRTKGTSVDTLGSTFEILNNYFKPYPSCRRTHTALDALLALIEQHSLSADDVATVSVLASRRDMALNSLRPVSIEHAQYSFPFVVGAVLAYGHHGPDTMTEEKLTDPAILRQAEKVVLKSDPSLGGREHMAEVTIETVAGQTYRLRKRVRKGDREEPMSEAELTAKFLALASPVVGADTANKALEVIQDLGTLEDVRELAALLDRALRQAAVR